MFPLQVKFPDSQTSTSMLHPPIPPTPTHHLHHKSNPLSFLPFLRRLHPRPHRRHPQHLGPPRRLGLQFRPPGSPLNHAHHALRPAEMLRGELVRAVLCAQVCAAGDEEAVREEELSECGGEGYWVWEYCGGGECSGRVRWYVCRFEKNMGSCRGFLVDIRADRMLGTVLYHVLPCRFGDCTVRCCCAERFVLGPGSPYL